VGNLLTQSGQQRVYRQGKSTVAIAAIVNEVAASSTIAKQSTAYNTFSAGSGNSALPASGKHGQRRLERRRRVMNTASTTTTVTVSYFDTSTGTGVGTTQTQSLAPRVLGSLPIDRQIAQRHARTAVITTSSGGQVAAICNESNAAMFMSYDGQ